MGIGFWIIQAVFLIAAIATAVYVEREHRRDEREWANAPHRKIRIEPARARRADTATQDFTPALRGASQFSVLEQSRLLVLRDWVHEARAHRGHWYDDLAPDEPEPPTSPRMDDTSSTVSSSPRRAASPTLALAAGVLLLALGCLGIWRTNAQMDGLERAQQASIAVPRMSFMSRLVPGVIANPSKYLGAVNSSSGSASGDPLTAPALLEQKQAMDRYEALLGIGLALLVGSAAGWPARTQPPSRQDGGSAPPQHSSIASDLVPFMLVAALLLAALSFFELA